MNALEALLVGAGIIVAVITGLAAWADFAQPNTTIIHKVQDRIQTEIGIADLIEQCI